jgi:hypothetical protein
MIKYFIELLESLKKIEKHLAEIAECVQHENTYYKSMRITKSRHSL